MRTFLSVLLALAASVVLAQEPKPDKSSKPIVRNTAKALEAKKAPEAKAGEKNRRMERLGKAVEAKKEPAPKAEEKSKRLERLGKAVEKKAK